MQPIRLGSAHPTLDPENGLQNVRADAKRARVLMGNPKAIRDDAIPSAAAIKRSYEQILGKPASAR
jgi:hypothetical protein